MEITIEKAIQILNEAPTIILRGDEFDEACRMAVTALCKEVQPQAQMKTCVLCARCGNPIEEDAPDGVTLCGSCADGLMDEQIADESQVRG